MTRFRRFTGADHPSRLGELEGTLFAGPALSRRGAPDTSREAADAVQGRVELLRRRVVERYRGVSPNGLTPDECAVILGETVLSIRPRCTELSSARWCRQHLHSGPVLERTATRRTTASGCRAYVLRWRDHE